MRAPSEERMRIVQDMAVLCQQGLVAHPTSQTRLGESAGGRVLAQMSLSDNK